MTGNSASSRRSRTTDRPGQGEVTAEHADDHADDTDDEQRERTAGRATGEQQQAEHERDAEAGRAGEDLLDAERLDAAVEPGGGESTPDRGGPAEQISEASGGVLDRRRREPAER